MRVNAEAFEREFIGHVARINPQIDTASRTFQVEVHIPNEKHLLKPGAFVRARIFTHFDDRVVFIPYESVVTFAGISKVFTVVNDKAVENIVELGIRRGEYVEAASGLKGVESVVVEGASKLATGVAVTLRSVPGAATRPSTGNSVAP